MKYSVLMSVYYKETPAHLSLALESMLTQTLPADEIVLVEDGPLTDALQTVIEEKQAAYPGIINVLALEKNGGLGRALRAGLEVCRNEYVARMDSDDISFPERMEKEMAYIDAHPETDILSCVIEEFDGDTDHIVARRVLPTAHSDIVEFAKTRTPFNHVATVFKKSKVLEAGSYNGDFPLVEDHELWVRMIERGAVCANLPEAYVYVRCGDEMHVRRRGGEKVRALAHFYKKMLGEGFITFPHYLFNIICGCGLQLMPVGLHKLAYKIIRREKHPSPASTEDLLYTPTDAEERFARKEILGIFTDVQAVCVKHGLTLMLGGGSCLGAVRHKGYIPWDDDMDAIMPRADYEELKRVFAAELSSKYILQVPRCEGCIASNLFMKIIQKNGMQRKEIETCTAPGAKGLWLDIVPMDWCPDDPQKRRIKAFAADVLRYTAVSRYLFKYRNPACKRYSTLNPKDKLIYYFRMALGFMASFRSTDDWYALYDNFVQGEKSHTVTFGAGRNKYWGEAHDVGVFLPPVKGEFEGMEVNLPARAHEYLRSMYGADYMIPASKHEKHIFVK